jgi:oxygen-dependent protoporphyrinogen oxidase
VRAWEARFPEGFAIMDAEQRARVAGLERTLESKTIVLAGSAFHGSGVECAIRSGTEAARKLSSTLRR